MVMRGVLSTICDMREGSIGVGLSGRWLWMGGLGFSLLPENSKFKESRKAYWIRLWTGQRLDLYLNLTNVLHGLLCV